MKFRCVLVLITFVLLGGPAKAQDAQKPPDRNGSANVTQENVEKNCVDQQSGEQTHDSNDNSSPCDSSLFEFLPSNSRQELSDEVSENTQDALSLKRILLGRSFTFFGRVEPEYAAYFDGILQDEDGSDIRRLRAGLVGVLSDSVSYKGEFDLTDGSNNFSDFYLQWDSTRFGSLKIGNQRVAQNLSAMTGALSLLFMERPLPVSTFSLGRRLAVSQDLYFNRFGVHAVFFTRDPNNDAGKYGASVRVITNPIRSNGGVAHLGFSLVRETLDKETRYRTRPESHVTNIRLVDTGEYLDVEHRNILGVELAGARGGFTARLEGFVSQWERVDSRENEFYGAYLELGHFLTGQEFRYRDGKFVRPQIENGARAWEVGVRVSWVDLDDQDVRGGIQKNLGFALNWYPRRNVRAQFNLIYYDAARDAGDENGWIAQTRIQLNW